jgi:hypothetical protein
MLKIHIKILDQVNIIWMILLKNLNSKELNQSLNILQHSSHKVSDRFLTV